MSSLTTLPPLMDPLLKLVALPFWRISPLTKQVAKVLDVDLILGRNRLKEVQVLILKGWQSIGAADEVVIDAGVELSIVN